MKDTTLISVVTPIYNGASFIKSTYDCLCRQSYRHWEWVVVDDGSTDDTRQAIRQLSDTDCRIRYTLQRNTGSAKLPRDRAVFQAKGELVLPLDIDDRITDDYLQRMLERMQETNADIVYPQMHFVDLATGKTTLILPEADFDIKQTYCGRDLVKDTLPQWRIGCNGGLYRRQMWVNMGWLEEHDPVFTYSDEVDERYYLLQAQRVAFSKAQYFYQNHGDSITNKPSTKQFHLLKSNLELLHLMARAFGKGSEEYHRANYKMLCGWRSMTAYYLQNYQELPDAEAQIRKNLSETFHAIEPSLLPIKEQIKFLFLINEHLLMVLMALKYAPKWPFEKLIQHFSPIRYRFKVLRQRTEKQMRQQLQESYAHAPRKTHAEPYAVSMFCGNVSSGGLVDRLRGAISLYAACQQAGRPFRLFFTHPFPLTDYLQPNKYDWTIDDDDVTFAPSQTHIVVLDTQTDTHWEREWQQQQFVGELTAHNSEQLHFYCNASFCYDQDFASLFHELFRPSERLQSSIDKVLKTIGGSYITVSARFCNLLGDFNEETFSEPLSRQEQKELIDICLKQIDRLHQQHDRQLIVVCSDSTTFAEAAQHFDYVRVIPGSVSHIGNDHIRHYSYYEKTFLDFFVISQAQQVYLLKGPGMHESGFPYAAARIGRKNYHIIDL